MVDLMEARTGEGWKRRQMKRDLFETKKEKERKAVPVLKAIIFPAFEILEKEGHIS